MSTTCFGFRPGTLEHVVEPSGYFANSRIMLIVAFGVTMGGSIPIAVRDQFLGENARVAERKREALSPGGIARGSAIADECDAVAIRMIHPNVHTFERRRRTVGTRTIERNTAGTRRFGLRLKAGEIVGTLQTMALIRMKSKVRTGAVSGLREKSDYAR